MVVMVRRVKSASVIVEDKTVSSINQGFLIYVGIANGDTKENCEYAAKKVANLRIFDSENGEISVQDIKGELLSVSQFTLSADTKKGNRPSYTQAMTSSEAEPMFDYFNECLKKESGLEVQTGVFGADMIIPSIDDGPFTILITSKDA